jgi:hypothetical protein
MAAFTQKQNTIYIFDGETGKEKWHIMNTEDINKITEGIIKKLLRMFVLWQTENHAKIMACEKMKDKELMYMGQFIRARTDEDKMNSEIKKWLYTKLEEKIATCYDFV